MGDRSCAAIVHNGFILMVRQTYKGETFWTFPGGSIEPTETPLQCAIRETKEETGLEIKIIEKVCEFYNARINGTYHCYLAQLAGGIVFVNIFLSQSDNNKSEPLESFGFT